jgi:selenocysteine-specific elongation factor
MAAAPAAPVVPYILATAGHVDHGKSAIVQALTGTDPDRLPEEKRRGITIDLGFALMRLASPPGITPAAEYHLGVVDVPGHEDFIRNMVAGVGSIDAALLVVAADDGWMPQTQEHLQILTFLGVRRGVIALSKIDLAKDETASRASLREHLANTSLADAPIIATSVRSGRGIAELKAALAGMFSRMTPQRDIGKPRMAIDRAFTIKGAGTIVTGTLTGGSIRRGQEVAVQPGGHITRVRGIQTHNRDVELGVPGMRVALNLPDLHPRSERADRPSLAVARGDVVTIPEGGKPTQTIDVRIDLIQLREVSGRLETGLKNGDAIRLYHGAAAIPARIYFFDPAKAGDSPSLARLRLEKPVLALAGDRFVIRDGAETRTLGGGVVLDPMPPNPSGRRPAPGSPGRLLLERRAAAIDDPPIFVMTELARDGVVERKSLLAQSRFSREEIESAIMSGLEAKHFVAAGDLLVNVDLWQTTSSALATAIDAHHESQPHQAGLPLADVRKMKPAKVGNAMEPRLIESAIVNLCQDGFVLAGASIRRRDHRPALPQRLQAAGQLLRRRLGERRLDPPSRKELCTDDLSHQAMKFLIAAGEAVEINKDLVISAEGYAMAVAKVRAFLHGQAAATVSELKTALGSSRRIMVPLLEKLDADGITQRQGDLRRLREEASVKSISRQLE